MKCVTPCGSCISVVMGKTAECRFGFQVMRADPPAEHADAGSVLYTPGFCRCFRGVDWALRHQVDVASHDAVAAKVREESVLNADLVVIHDPEKNSHADVIWTYTEMTRTWPNHLIPNLVVVSMTPEDCGRELFTFLNGRSREGVIKGKFNLICSVQDSIRSELIADAAKAVGRPYFLVLEAGTRAVNLIPMAEHIHYVSSRTVFWPLPTRLGCAIVEWHNTTCGLHLTQGYRSIFASRQDDSGKKMTYRQLLDIASGETGINLVWALGHGIIERRADVIY